MKKIFISFFIFILSFSFAIAQETITPAPTTNPYLDLFNENTGLPIGVTEQISTQIIPQIPNPGEVVNISVESYSTDLNKASFTWKSNGAVISQGTGQKTFTFSAPESGKTTTINLTIKKEGGGLIEKTFSFSPANVDIIYEANTYTHPYYKGKSLFTSESEIRLVAMPDFVLNGITVNPNSLVYNWSINGTVDQTNSGFGKRIYRAKGGLIQRPLNVEVTVSAINSSLKAKNSVLVKGKQPEVLLYENNPLLGVIFEKAVFGNFLLERPEVSLQAIPYFFSTPTKEAGFIEYSWKMNGSALEVGGKSSSVKLRNETGEEGRAIISLETNHFENILQSAKSNLDLNFKEIKDLIKNNENFDF